MGHTAIPHCGLGSVIHNRATSKDWEIKNA